MWGLNDARFLSLVQGIATCDQLHGLEAIVPTARSLFNAEVLVFGFNEHGLSAVAGGFGEVREYPQHLLPEDPLQTYVAQQTPESRVYYLTDAVPRETLWRSPAYHEFYRPSNVEHGMSGALTALPYGQPGHTGVFLARSAKQEPFAAPERAMFEWLLPSIAAVARRDAEKRATPALAELVEMRSQRPMLICSLTGELLWSSRGAAAMLRSAWGTDAVLPTPLVTSVRALSSTRPTQMPVGSLRLMGDHGAAVTFDFQVVQRGEGFVLVELIGDAVAALTPAETQVLRFLEQGMSNREIAEVLEISVETARIHAKRVCTKRGVRSRLELVLQKRF